MLKQVSRMNDLFDHVHEEQIQASAIEGILRIDELLKDFEVKTTPPNVFAILSGAFGMVSGGAGTVGAGATSGATGLISGLFGVVAQFNPPKVDEGVDLNTIILDFFEQSSKTMQDIISRSLGYGDMNRLPQSLLTHTDNPETEVGMFFEDGKFLLEDIGIVMADIIAESKTRMVCMSTALETRRSPN